MIGIIGAMPEEIEALLELLSNKSISQKGPFELHKGQLNKQDVMIAKCGISKVNAAALTQVMILEGVSKIIFTGVAGGLETDMKVGDIVISTDCMQYDVDVTALGYELGHIPGESLSWQADKTMHNAALKAANEITGISVYSGRILSADLFLDSAEKVAWLRDTFKGSCAEMEGASVAQICSKWNIPFVIIRSISDTGDEDSKMDFREFTPLAAERAKQVVEGMLKDKRIQA